MPDTRRIKLDLLESGWDRGKERVFSVYLLVHMGEIVGGGVLCG